MILILLGTSIYEFNRLLNEVQRCIDNGVINQEIIVQAGGTKFTSEQMKIFDLIAEDELEELMKKSDVIITHGGVGSIVSAVKLRKKVIAVPRLQKYGEVANDHQIQIIDNFAKEGFIIGIHDVSELEEALKQVNEFEPKVLESNTQNIINIIKEFVDKQGK